MKPFKEGLVEIDPIDDNGKIYISVHTGLATCIGCFVNGKKLFDWLEKQIKKEQVFKPGE